MTAQASHLHHLLVCSPGLCFGSCSGKTRDGLPVAAKSSPVEIRPRQCWRAGEVGEGGGGGGLSAQRTKFRESIRYRALTRTAVDCA